MERANVIKEEAPRDKSASEEESIYGGKMDFGGLPDSDLKKNLGGCG